MHEFVDVTNTKDQCFILPLSRHIKVMQNCCVFTIFILQKKNPHFPRQIKVVQFLFCRKKTRLKMLFRSKTAIKALFQDSFKAFKINLQKK